MPHVVIESTGELQAVYQAFAPMLQRTEGEIVKVQECYLAKSGREALLDAVVIEQGTARSFFIQLKRHETTITVRLLPATDPEKTPAVTSSMALVAGLIRKVYSASRYGKTNLQEYLDSPVSM